MMDEFELIRKIKKWVPRRLQGKLGIGDDAEMLCLADGKDGVVTTDTIVEGVDFLYRKASPEEVGHKALAVNLSDLAAMGAKPQAFVVTLGLPNHVKTAWVEKFYWGLIRLASRYRVICLGGDLTSAKEIFVSVTLIGIPWASKVVTRRGAKAGEWIGVTGDLGGSILGRHLNFNPRVEESRFLARHFCPSSMIDISDGLLQDLGHILEASRVGADLDLARIPVSRAAKSLEHALTDGEDFELLFTVPLEKKYLLENVWKKTFSRVRLSWIGRTTSSTNKIRWFEGPRSAAGPRLARKGYTHFPP